jgi:hypothetical protein
LPDMVRTGEAQCFTPLSVHDREACKCREQTEHVGVSACAGTGLWRSSSCLMNVIDGTVIRMTDISGHGLAAKCCTSQFSEPNSLVVSSFRQPLERKGGQHDGKSFNQGDFSLSHQQSWRIPRLLPISSLRVNCDLASTSPIISIVTLC